MTAATATQRGSLAKIRDDLTFLPHQLDGIRELARRNSFILADEMGLGKSLQALTVAAIDFEKDWARRMLIVAPATLKGNWAEEIEKHTHFTAMVLDGTPKQRAKQLAAYRGDPLDVLIVNYEQLKPHGDELNDIGFDIVLMDEAHLIKGHRSHRTKAAQALRAQRFFLLTGSPMLNHVNELWSLLHRVDPMAYPNYYSFVHRYCIYGGFKDKEIVGVKHQAELTEKLNAVMLRRRKSEVLDLPDKHRVTVWVDMHPTQARLIKQANDEMRIDLPNDPTPMELENALTKFLRIKQILSTPANIEGCDDDSTKLDVAVERIAEVIESGEPVVVFTQFRGTIAALQRRLNAAGIDHRALHGDVPVAERQPTVRAWAEDAANGKPQALLCMLQVAGVGLTMTAASTLIFVDKLFVPKLNEQAEDRVHRIGADKTKPVTIIDILVRRSLEQRIERILQRKSDLFGQVVEQDSWKRALYAALAEDDDE